METTKLRRFAQYARRTLLELIEARLQLVLQTDSAARRENLAAVKQLEAQILASSREQVIDRVAYTWFNRFCALRYMDVNRVNRISVVSPLDGQFQPEMLAEAKMGHIDEEMVPAAIQAKVRALLDGTAPSPDPQQEAYRLLVVAACNYWQPAMPFLFERIADYTELLMPDDLLSGNSILSYTREAMTPDACQDVEVIGWLYQFYISEKKDAVFEGLKKNKKITPENIPAATQLFTPHWIVRYLVENSLGRLWLLNRPNSRLAGQMDYYIAPQEPVTDFLRIAKPEDIKLCDPACGSGHMLTYAFDLLYTIYEEEGTDPAEIPEKILTHNLYGIEIDERAAELAAFALAMKALSRFGGNIKQRRFLNKRIQPNICVLRPVKIERADLDGYMTAVGRDLFTANLRTLLTQFEEADNFGSLIRPMAMDYAEIRRVLAEKGIGNQLLLEHVHRDVMRVLEQAEYLSQRYQVVVANPPYMGSSGMNARLGAWAKANYPDSKADLFAIFIERNIDLVVKQGDIGMITMQSWMFLSSFEKLRAKLLNEKTLVSMAHLGSRAFDSIGGEVVSTTAFVLENASHRELKGDFVRLVDGSSEAEKDRMLRESVRNRESTLYHRAAGSDFQKIPGRAIAYWISKKFLNLFTTGRQITTYVSSRDGLTTGENEKFIRYWWEVGSHDIPRGCKTSQDFWKTKKKWAPLIKGGSYRKWYGNVVNVIAYDVSAYEVLSVSGNKLPSREFYFLENLNWTRISSPSGSFRYCPEGYVFESASLCAYAKNKRNLFFAIAAANSVLSPTQLDLINPTVNLLSGYFDMLTFPHLSDEDIDQVSKYAESAIDVAKFDWECQEVSMDYVGPPLLKEQELQLSGAFTSWRNSAIDQVGHARRIENEINRILLKAASLDEDIRAEVSASEITLSCNPHYRYGGDRTEQELEDLLRADTMREFISYAVGCMFGRYSLDKPGLILANQGETLADYLRQVPQPRFTPDADNVIPLLDGDWFPDDITGRFRDFLRVTFGDEHYDENLRFIEAALGKKGKPLTIRDFFLKEFYTDHVKRYKKRPIYWLFSSPKGSFNALIYLHRYRPDNVSVVLQYLRDFRSKLAAHRAHLEQVSISTSASQGEKTKALKEIETLKKTQSELDDYERDTLYPLATHQVALDLDDGVKVNYLKLGAALKKIPGLDAKDED
jgi:type II restriction/modification system DNA methylase subunit YeeA